MFDIQNKTPDALDYELRKDPAASLWEPPPRTPFGVWIAAAVLIVAAAIAAYFAFGRPRSSSTARGSDAAPTSAAADRPLGGEVAPIVVPPLDQTDPLVRELVKQITSHPLAAAWLATNGLIRNFAVALSNAADGRTPSAHLRVLRPTAPFQVTNRGGRLVIDPRSFQRYDGLAAAAASIEPQGAARLYATLKPRIEEAYRELGSPEPLDHALQSVIVELLQVPIVAEPIPVVLKGGTGYAYADPSLESLTSLQKQLLRTGPANVRTIQSSLRAIAGALGIPPDRLSTANAASRSRT